MVVDRERWIALGGAVAVHLLLFAVLGFGLTAEPEPPANAANKPLIQARAVSEEQVMEPHRRRVAEEQAERQRIAEQKRRAEVARQQAAAERKRQAEASRRAEEEARRKAAESRRQAELKRKQEAEKARLAELEKQRRIEAERRAEEAHKQAEARRIAEERARQQADAERLRRETEEQARREAEARLKAAMAAEEARLAEEASARQQARLNTAQSQYVADISNKVQRNWLRPSGSRGSYCRVLIRQIPGGEVVDVRLSDCDGDVAFQRSVEAAVRKASPLPAPPVPEVFEREIEFIFEP